MSHANLHGAVFTNVKFNKTDLRHANLSYATFNTNCIN
ncbi:MAG: pentapeptide repeat-containing protein [Pseudomonadota bacterium]|nr:pentapeptide repeat-containing protein [Pseudomonadota bacterium]